MYDNLPLGVPTVVTEDEKTQTVVTRSAAGWTTQMVFKPGFEPVIEPTDHEKLVALLVDKAVLSADDAVALGVDPVKVDAVLDAEAADADVAVNALSLDAGDVLDAPAKKHWWQRKTAV